MTALEKMAAAIASRRRADFYDDQDLARAALMSVRELDELAGPGFLKTVIQSVWQAVIDSLLEKTKP